MTEASALPAPSAVPETRQMSPDDVIYALKAGLRDFRRDPALGLFFGFFYAIGGFGIVMLLFVMEWAWLAVPLAVGFPLIGPFAAVGLYEISRRIEASESWTASDIIGVMWQQTDRQMSLMAWVVIVFFLFWTFFAHMLFALFIGPSFYTNILTSYAFLLQPEGLMLLLVGTLFGAVFAAVLFSLTVVSLPLLLEKELDFVTAMITSVSVVRDNPKVMARWALVVAALTFAAMLPAFLGLIIVFPVLGHATWHIYRRALNDPEAPAAE
ncbi:MAG: DUF2189 domain-containing protein [Pseudomonadota bacterium]